MNDIFEGSIRSKGDIGVFFEYMDGAGYMYVCIRPNTPQGKIIDHIRIYLNKDIDEGSKLEFMWNKNEEFVCLYLNNDIVALYGCESGMKKAMKIKNGKYETIDLSEFGFVN